MVNSLRPTFSPNHLSNDLNVDSKSGKFLEVHQRLSLLNELKTDLRLEYRRRIQIMLLADRGWSQSQICKELQCSHQTARYWINVVKIGQIDQWKELPLGSPSKVDEQYLARLKELVNQNPRDHGYSFQQWTAQWLRKHLAKEFDIEVSDRHINRLLKKIGASTRRPKSQLENEQSPSGDESATVVTSELGIVISKLHSSEGESLQQVWLFNPNSAE